MAKVLTRLEEAINRNTEVLKSTVDTVEYLSKSCSKTPTTGSESPSEKLKRTNKVARIFGPRHEKTGFSHICENKDADQISAFVFTTWIVQSLYFLDPTFQASSNLL